MTRIGFVGLGMMGSGIAANLQAQGHPLTVLVHRNRAGAAPLLAAGATEAASLEALSLAADVLFLCLPSSEVVEAVIGELRACMRRGQLVVDCTTADPASTRRLAASLERLGVDLIDAPVIGGPPVAARGALTSLIGANPGPLERARPLIAAYSASIVHFGPPSSGHTAKLFANFVSIGQGALIAECFAAARSAGIDWGRLLEVMMGGGARSALLERIVPPAIAGDFKAQAFSIANAAKDVRYFAELAQSLGRRSTLVDAIADRLNLLEAHGHGARFASEQLDPALDIVHKVSS